MKVCWTGRDYNNLSFLPLLPCQCCCCFRHGANANYVCTVKKCIRCPTTNSIQAQVVNDVAAPAMVPPMFAW